MASLIPWVKKKVQQTEHAFNAPQQNPIGSVLQSAAHAVNDVVNPAFKAQAVNYDLVRAAIARATNNTQATNNALQATKRDYQSIGNSAQNTAQTFVTRPAATWAGALRMKQGSYTPGSTVEKTIFGNNPIQNVQKNVGNTYASNPNLPVPARVGLAGADLLGQAAMVLPVVGGGSKIIKQGAKDAQAVKATKSLKPLGQEGSILSGLFGPKQSLHYSSSNGSTTFSGKADKVRNALKLNQSGSTSLLTGGSGDARPHSIFAKQYGDMLHQMDKTSQGGNKFKATANGAPQMSAKSPFYRSFRAENGKAPTKADYHTEAQKQLEAGKADPAAVKEYNALKNPKKNVPLPTKLNPNAEQNVFDANPMAPKVRATPAQEPVDNNLLTTMDKVIANSGGTPQEAARGRLQAVRNADAERAALDHLQKGGSRDEAIAIYQKTAKTSQKNAKYRVQQAAKESKTPLNVSKHTENPLMGKFHQPDAKTGEYLKAPQNQATVVNNITKAEERAYALEKKLHPEDKANIGHYAEGTMDISKAHDPALVQQAVEANTNLTDTIHALDGPHGKTPHVDKFFPRYFKNLVDQSPKAQMAAEEAALAGHPIPLEDTGNYNGFHNKQRVFKTRAEAAAAKFELLHSNPYDDLLRYAAGAKISIGNQAFIKSVRQAQGALGEALPADIGQAHTIDLPGTDSVKVNSEGARILKNYGVRKPAGRISLGKYAVVPKRFMRGVNTTVVKTIVANPLFHGGNQEFNALFQGAWRMPGNKVANMLKLLKNHANVSEADRVNFYRDGNFSPDYGKNTYGFIAKGLGKAGINPAHAELSPRGMAFLEENIRVSLWKMGKERGLTPEQNTKVINQVLGGADVLNDMTSTVGLFVHYFKTNVKLLGDIGVQASKGNVAPLTGLAVGTAAWLAATKGWQEVTGNDKATLRAPGALGVATQLIKAVPQARRGQIPSVITNHTNPAISWAAQQATNRDFHKPIPGPSGAKNSLDGPGGTGRVKNTTSTLFGPGTTIQNTAGQKTSLPEAGLGYVTGLYTPHAKGYQAAPNIPFLNTKNAQKGTGMAAQDQHFKAQGTLDKTIYGDKRATDAVNAFLDRNKNDKGATIQLNPREKISAYAGLASNDKALSAIQTYMKNGSDKHPPMWDLSKNDLRAYLDYEATRKTDPEKGVKLDQGTGFNNGEGLSNFIKRNSDWYNQQPKHPGQAPVPAAGTPTYPKISQSVQDQLTTRDNITDPKIKAQYTNAHPDVVDAFAQIAKYNNDLGVAQGGNAVKNYPDAAPALQKWIDSYSSADKSTRKSLRTSSPQQYKNMVAYFDSVDLYTINKEGAKNMYQGQPDQTPKQNKAVSNLAKDIYQNADGSYSIVPAGWMDGLKNGSGSGFGSSKTKKPKYIKPTVAKFKAPKAPKGIKVKKLAYTPGKTRKLSVSKIPKIG